MPPYPSPKPTCISPSNSKKFIDGCLRPFPGKFASFFHVCFLILNSHQSVNISAFSPAPNPRYALLLPQSDVAETPYPKLRGGPGNAALDLERSIQVSVAASYAQTSDV